MSVTRRIAGAVGVVLVVAAAAGLAWPWVAPSRKSTPVLRLPGVVEVQEIRLGSKVGGRVREVRRNKDGAPVEGELVERDSPLVTFAVPELEAQYEQWQARLATDEALLTKLQNGARPEEIDAAKAAVAAALARSERAEAGYREEEVRQARNDLESAEADLKLSEEELARADRLWQRRSVPQSELDAARASYDRARGRALAAKARSDMLKTGSRREDKAEAVALLQQAQANLRLLQAGTRREDVEAQKAKVVETRAKLLELKANLDEAIVKAPSRCVVDIISVRPGDLVAPGQIVVRVLQAEDLWVKVFIPETELGKIRLGQPATVTVDSYPDKKLAGAVVFLSTQSEFTPRNIQSVDERRHQVFAAKVRVADPRGVFKSGMAAQVALPVASASGGR
jgi:HlyD family secretion protein